jgi:2,4-dienoyl-CoA reductase-like NADH-dependent reductase (Old Yellow Enzyme family)
MKRGEIVLVFNTPEDGRARADSYMIRRTAVTQHIPYYLTVDGIQEIIGAFAHAARRACEAGFRVLEVHGAHGYLIHEFLSPLSNHRDDAYGGSFENRTRFIREIVTAVRASWPKGAPLFVRISATDWVEGGWDLQQSIELARELKRLGVDLIDCSSGGSVPHAKIPAGPGYQTPFARQIREKAEILTGAVGMITSPIQAEQIIATGEADAILIAREFLRDPYWPLRAAKELGQSIAWPVQYLRAAPRGAQARVPVNLEKLRSCFEEQHAVLHRGQHEVGRSPGVLGGREFAPELVVTSGALTSLRSNACPLPAQECEQRDADQDPAHRDEDRDRVHRRAV